MTSYLLPPTMHRVSRHYVTSAQVVVDFLVSAGIKPTSIVSYNHLGNNDGKNLSAPQTFRSKEVRLFLYGRRRGGHGHTPSCYGRSPSQA